MVEIAGSLTARKGTIKKKNTVATKCANAVSQKDVKAWLKKHHGESVVPARECSPVTNVMPTTTDRTNKASLCVKNSIKAQNVKKILSYKRRRPEDHMCGEVHCLNCEDFVDPNTHQCYMKPIVNQEEDSAEVHEAQSKPKKKKKGQRKRRRVSEEMISHEVEEEDRQDEEGQEYLFFDIESRQDDGQHIANLLIV